MKQHAATGILFNTDRSKVLLVKRRDIPVWVLPGGGIEKDETPERAVCREMEEETGYTVKVKRKIALYLPVNNFTRHTHFFECEVVNGELSTGSETQEVCFFPLTELPKRLAPPYRGWIADAAANYPYLLEKPIVGVSYWMFCWLLISHPILVGRFLLTKLGIHCNSSD